MKDNPESVILQDIWNCNTSEPRDCRGNGQLLKLTFGPGDLGHHLTLTAASFTVVFEYGCLRVWFMSLLCVTLFWWYQCLFCEDNFTLSFVLLMFTQLVQRSLFTPRNLLCLLSLSFRNWGWLLVFCVASFPSCLSSTSWCNSWHFYFLCRVGCDVIEKGTGLSKFSQLLGGAAQVCWGACTQEEKQGILHSE